MSWILLSLVAGATSLSELSNSERYLMLCEAEAEEEDGDWEDIVEVWEACVVEAGKRGHDDMLARHRGNLSYARLRLEHGDLPETQPVAFARILLETQANQPDALLPFDVVRDAWLRLMADPAEQQNLVQVRTVTIRMQPMEGADREQTVRIEDLLERYIGDLGFKVVDSKEASAADSAILLFVQPEVVHLQEADLDKGKLEGWQVTLRTQPVRFKRLEKQGAHLNASARADLDTQAEALDAALNDACQALAQELLLHVIAQVFATN